MPKAFLDCIKKGGKVFTIKIGKDKYRHGCELKGKTYYGEIKNNKNNSDKKS